LAFGLGTCCGWLNLVRWLLVAAAVIISMAKAMMPPAAEGAQDHVDIAHLGVLRHIYHSLVELEL